MKYEAPPKRLKNMWNRITITSNPSIVMREIPSLKTTPIRKCRKCEKKYAVEVMAERVNSNMLHCRGRYVCDHCGKEYYRYHGGKEEVISKGAIMLS